MRLLSGAEEVAGDEDGLEDVVFFEFGFAGGFVEGEEAGGAGGDGDAGGGLGGEVIGEGEIEAAALGVGEVLAMFEGRGGVEFGGEGEFGGFSVCADSGFEFDGEADVAIFLHKNGFALVVNVQTEEGWGFLPLLGGRAGAGFGFDACVAEVLHGAGFYRCEQFVEFGAVI